MPIVSNRRSVLDNIQHLDRRWWRNLDGLDVLRRYQDQPVRQPESYVARFHRLFQAGDGIAASFLVGHYLEDNRISLDQVEPEDKLCHFRQGSFLF